MSLHSQLPVYFHLVKNNQKEKVLNLLLPKCPHYTWHKRRLNVHALRLQENLSNEIHITPLKNNESKAVSEENMLSDLPVTHHYFKRQK